MSTSRVFTLIFSILVTGMLASTVSLAIERSGSFGGALEDIRAKALESAGVPSRATTPATTSPQNVTNPNTGRSTTGQTTSPAQSSGGSYRVLDDPYRFHQVWH